MLRLLARNASLVAWAGLILSIVCLFLKLGAADPASLSVWISSDTLALVNVATDVLGDGFSFSGWRFSIVTFCFPDVFAAGLFWMVTRNPIAATLLAGFLQVVLLVVVFFWIREAVGFGDPSLQNVFLLAFSVTITLFVADHIGLTYPDFHHLFLPGTHVGSLVVSLAALASGLLCIRRVSERARVSPRLVILYAALCLLAGMSNLMFFPQMLLPFTVAIGFAALFNIFPLRDCWQPILAGWPATGAGIVLSRVLFHTAAVSAQSQISRHAALTALDVFARGAMHHMLALETLHVMALAWILVCLAIVAATLRAVRGRHPERVDLRRRMLCLFCVWSLLSALCSTGAIIAGGSNGLTVFKDYNWTTHYLQSVFFIPLFGLPMLLSWFIHRLAPGASQFLAFSVGLVVLAVAVIRLASVPRPQTEITHYRPPLVQFLDSQASLYGLKYGVGGYWQSRITTLLSSKGLRVYAVDGSFNPFLWETNVDWYTQQVHARRKKPPVDFVILDDPAFKLSREGAKGIFGEPTRELRFQDTRVLIYTGGTRNVMPSPVASDVRNDLPFTTFSERITSSVRFLAAHPGDTTSAPLTIVNTGGNRWVSAGKYPVTLSYRWFDSGKVLSLEGVRTLLPQPVNPGQTVSLNARIVVPQDGKNLVLRLSLVQEGVAWFFMRGAAPLDIPVNLCRN
ncbi:MAG: hypothetical protein ABSF54_09750 [Bryobacteraceae bacterium]|jgi:hypothetical protein